MSSFFCSTTRRQNLERKQAAVSAVLATLEQTSKPESKVSTPDDFYAVFAEHYKGDVTELPQRRLGKALRTLSESKRKEEIRKKLEKKNSTLERKLSTSSASTVASSTKSSAASSTTMVDSSDDEKEGKKSSESDGAPLELTWTWSALGEAF